MKFKKSPEQEIQYDEDSQPFVMYGKKQVPVSAFYRETVRFVDPERAYWHGMDCTRDLVIHLTRDCDRAVVAKMYE
jgi:hypothetical protein